jgi:hypothetical protein
VGGAESGALSTDSVSIGTDLAMIVERWPTLPADAKAAILAIVEAADQPDGP